MSGRIDNPKNIIVSTHDCLSPVRGGGALRTLRVAYEFRRRGHNVLIAGPTDSNTKLNLNGMKVLEVRPPRKQHSQILSAIKFNTILLRKLLRFVKNTDLIFIHNTIAAIFLPFLKRIFKFRFVLDITDIHAEYLPLGKRNLFERLLTPFLLKYEYFIISSADFITVATKIMKEFLISKGIASSKIEIVYDGTDKQDLPQQKEPGAEYGIIHLGTIDRQHGVEILVKAIPDVIVKFPQARFFFVGGGRELLNVKKLAKKLEVIDHCIFTDYLTCDEARQFLKKATIGIIPRQDVLPNRIITTLKIYEYWASQNAVVSTYLEGIREIASGEDNILWFKPGDIHDLSEKIIFLLKHKEFKEKLIKTGLATVDKFDFKASASKIADFAEDLIAVM